MDEAFGLTGYSGPVKPTLRRLSRICQPIVLERREAPMTAMDFGRRMASRELMG